MQTRQAGALSIKKTVRLALAVLLLAGGVWLAKLIWFKPFDIDHFFNRVFIEFALDNPEMLSQMRLLEPMGLTFHNDDLTEASIGYQLELAQKLRDDLATLRSYDRDELEGQQRLSYDILEYFLEDAVDGEQYMFHDYSVDQMGGVREIPKFGMRTLTYHEATPGHHFQIAAQQELEGVPIFRTIPLFTAYTEGWALYAEYLAKELGYQEDPYDDLGRLQAELFRAVRLVVDTGIHARRWTREETIDYMLANTGMVEGEVVTEVERYIVWPGQACAYKIGMLEILELRERARRALGDDFDLPEFHNVVLENGAVPMEILERLVDAYIQREGGAPSRGQVKG